MATGSATGAPRFSIVMPDYEATVPRDALRRAVVSVLRQSSPAWELILLHDGPKAVPYAEELGPLLDDARIRHASSPRRFADWGHSLRDWGMKSFCRGDYVLHLNADNILYGQALEEIALAIDEEQPPVFDRTTGRPLNRPDMILFPIVMRGFAVSNHFMWRYRGQEQSLAVVLGGLPIRKTTVDCMQLAIRRELWLAEGGWTDRSFDADGALYERFAGKYGCRMVAEILGEHW